MNPLHFNELTYPFLALSHVDRQLVLENIRGGFQAGDVGRNKVADEDLVADDNCT